MEARYHDPEEDRFISEKVDFESYFNAFGKSVMEAFPDAKSYNPSTYGLSSEEVNEIKMSTKLLFPPAEKDEGLQDETGLKFVTPNPPPQAMRKLKSLKFFFGRSKAYTRDLKKKLSYSGEVNLEDHLVEEAAKYDGHKDLAPCGFYVLTVRVYLHVLHSKYTPFFRARDLQVSQEFLCLSSNGLDALRDRIACCNDFQPADGDISENLTHRTELRARDLHRSAMFYIGNDFFVDARHPENLDYSSAILKWGKREGYNFGDVVRMEDTTLAELNPLRLGYPYLYLHQGTCEHLLLFTDARLVHPRDPMDSSKYPLLMGFATLNGKFCFSCHIKTARYIVVDNDRLPEDAAYMCTACLMSYNYKGGQKIGRFKVYGYVARTALM